VSDGYKGGKGNGDIQKETKSKENQYIADKVKFAIMDLY